MNRTGTFGDLFHAAGSAAQNAYAPYSRFRVGAAVQSSSGQIHRGCNMENVAFPIGICAERAALAQAVLMEGPGLGVLGIEVVALDALGNVVPCTPCGACRQAIFELAPQARVRFRNASGQIVERTASQLLPEAFEFDAPSRPAR